MCIRDRFQTYRLTTADSQVFTGLKVKEDAKEVVIRDANGRDNRVAKDEVEALTPSKLSLMPDNVVSQISYDQFIDLLAFLKSKKEQESLRGLVVDAAVAGPFPNTAVSVKAISTGEWKPFAAGANGKFVVPPVSSGGPEVIFLRAYVFAPKGQKAAIGVESENPWSVSVNGSDLVPKPEPASETDLKEGWNVVVVKVTRGLKPAALGVRVSGDGLRTAAKPDTAPVANTGGR